ncbi:phospholipase D-like domain-containing protein [Xanthobacter sp. ZOL 2024]
MRARTIPSLLLTLFALSGTPLQAAEVAPETHYAPTENLESIDVALIGAATSRIDMAAYILTDHAVVDALVAAARRGVKVRIVIDPTQKQAYGRLAPLRASMRQKRERPIMHLKAYAIDGALLRTGSANFNDSALKHQDNDLILLHDPASVARYMAAFERIWDAAAPVPAAAANP